MSNENELLEPLATEAGQQAIARAINNLSSLEYAVRAERAATTATQKADEALNSAEDASDSATEARNWATKTDGYVAQETITIPPEQEGDDPTTETIDLYSARYYAALAQDIYNNLQFDSVPTENSTALVSSGAIYTALNGKADKFNTYTKTEVDTALSNVQGQLTFDNVPTANSDNPVKSSGIKTALDGKQDNLTFDSTPTANSNNPVTSGGIYTALQNVNIDIDDEITEDSDNPVTSAAIYAALQNFTPSGGGGGAGNASGVVFEELYDGGAQSPATNTNIVFNNNWTDYDLILFQFGVSNKIDKLVSKQTMNQNKGDTSKKIWFDFYNGGWYYDAITVINDNTIQFTVSQYSLNKIIGIKFSKNLSEQMSSNVLYENSSGWSSGSITLSDSLDNYDFIEVQGKLIDFQSMLSMYCDINQINNDNKFLYCGYSDKYMYVSKISSTELSAGTRKDFSIYKIIGYKLAKGGYSGIVSDARMTVKSGHIICPLMSQSVESTDEHWFNIVFDSPMPDTNYEVIVSKGGYTSLAYHTTAFESVDASSKTVNGFRIKIWCEHQVPEGLIINWVAIRPNSYTREGMVEDVLFSNASGVNSGTINLSGNISDYDLIDIQLYNSSIGYNNSILSPNNFINLNNGVKLSLYDNYAMTISYGSDSSINIDHHNSNSPYITKIIGIKFGRYVSGVAVDTTVTQGSSNVVTSGAVYDALQNAGGGSSITVDSTITQGGTNPVEGGAIYTALDDKADKSTTYTKTEVDTAVASKGDVTTNTDQNITGTKTFVGSKKVGFKQSTANDKLGFTLYSNSNTERGYLEFNPTNTIDGVVGLMTLGNYATSAGALTHVGFRRYSNISGASGAYNLLTPLIADAKTPFSLTTSYTNFYLPLGFTDGTTTVRTAKSGVVDLSPLLQAVVNSITNANGVSY